MLEKAPSTRLIKPLVEVIDPKILHRLSRLLRAKYGSIMVELPAYFLEVRNKYSSSIENLIAQYPDQATFYVKHKSLLDTPVISAQHIGNRDYDEETETLKKVKDDFKSVAVRVRVPYFELATATRILNSYKSLVSKMEENDSLLMDVFNLSGYETQINSNVELMSKIAAERTAKTFVLNAFEPIDNGHNFGPLLSFRNNLSGFGDFATERRFPPEGGRQPEKKVGKYYFWDRFYLKDFKRVDYDIVAASLKATAFWSNHDKHVSSCNACYALQHNDYNRSPTYWKAFRMIHYLHSITNETAKHFSSVTSDQDLDPDGFDILFNVEEI